MKFILYLMMLFTVFPSIVKAQDLATEHTQLLNNIELITADLRQLQSLENQIEMIKNQVEELNSVATYQNNFSDVDTLRNNLTNITGQGTTLFAQTQSLVTSIQQELNSLPANGTMTSQEESEDQNALNVLQSALNRVQQLRLSYQQQISSVNSLMNKNNQAVGQTQALQTSNELAAQNLTQNQSTQELLSEQVSIQVAMLSKQIQDEKNEDDTMEQILNDENEENEENDGNSVFSSEG